MANTGPFYFALVDPTDTTFDPTRHNLWDFEIFAFKRTLEEGKMPRLELTIKNPFRGLLEGKVWAHFSYHNTQTNTWKHLFFGRLVGQPKELDGTKLVIELITWPLDYVKQKQQVAETLKVDPFWDPVCVSGKDRDNPDTILEANTKLYHVDHLTGLVTASDIIVPEDGNVNFIADQTFYEFLDQTIEDPPLTAILMTMDCSWTQKWRGYVKLPDFRLQSYSGDGILGDWPKPLTSLGGGYTVFTSLATDANRVDAAQMVSASWSWQNPESTHADGDTLSANYSVTFPVFGGGYLSYNTLVVSVTGILDPYAVDENGDPSPLNKPASEQVNTMYVPLYDVTGSMTLLVQASRQRTEKVVMTLNGNFQPVLVDPTVQQDAESMTLSLADVGVPIVELLDFSTIAGTFVDVDTVIFPDFPSVPGGTTTQVVITAGIAAPFGSEPNFSDIPGVITTDVNGVQYVSLGTTNPTDGNQDWAANLQIAAGTIILPRQPLFTTWSVLQHPGAVTFPPVGVSISIGTKIKAANGTYWVATLPGTTNLTEPRWSSTRGDTIVDGSVTWTCLGSTIPTGNDLFLAITTGETGPLYMIPAFNTSALHAQTIDNGVTWVYIGSGDIPAGGTPENVTAAWYFPTTRGQRSLRYGIAKMRARMLSRLRCVTTKFMVSFFDGIDLTLRHSSTVTDTNRIPGGTCVGKNTLIELSGEAGKFRTNVQMKSCVGLDTTVTADPGAGVYAQSGVFQTGVQQMENSVVVLPTLTDVGYTPPVATVVDDGVSFPIVDPAQIILVDEVRGDITLGDQAAAIHKAFIAAATIPTIPFIHPIGSVLDLIANQKAVALLGADTVALELSKAQVWRDLQLKPLDAGPYGAYYIPKLTTLQGPKQIDLQSSS